MNSARSIAIPVSAILIVTATPVLAESPIFAERPVFTESNDSAAGSGLSSEFNQGAISSAGVRGLMQLMPATAKSEARRLRIAYSERRLLDDVDYNLTLGGTYHGTLVGANDGSYVLALAAYNAGGTRTRRWLRNWGDPRRGEIDVVDWIELIPVAETRNFVKRVIENLHVYRYRLGAND